MSNEQGPQRQEAPETEPSTIVESPNPPLSDEEILSHWDEDAFARAVPEYFTPPRLPRSHPAPTLDAQVGPTTFMPPHIGAAPYSSMCKVYYIRGGAHWWASGWIVEGNTGIKGIITSGHVVYYRGLWANSYVVRRQYSKGVWAEQFVSNFARTLWGWIHGVGHPWFWDIGAIIPSVGIPANTPSLGAVWNYPYVQSPFNYYYDVGYPSKPANGYPFNGEFMWESDGSLIAAHRPGDGIVLEAYNAMEQGSSGSPWLIYDPLNHIHYAAGVQSDGWDGIPSSYSPYFEQRNIVALLRDIRVVR